MAPDAPVFAILVPSRDRHDALRRSLPALRAAARSGGGRVLVCDQSAEPFPAADGVEVLHRPDLPGLPAARNVLLDAAGGAGVVGFCDDDAEPAANFGAVAVRLARDEPEFAAWGPVVETRPRRVQHCHRLTQLGCLRDPRRLLHRRRDAPTTALFGCCFAVRRDAAVAVGGFDARRPGYALGEDLDFFLRLGAAGYRLRFSRELACVHREDAAGRADPRARGRAKARFLRWLARRHGGRNPATLLHLGLALAGAAAGRGREPAAALGVLRGLGERSR